jgi:SAM-dependent methyltransferase
LSTHESEWDAVAEARHRQIISGNDVSYHKILIPTIMRLIGDASDKTILDVGCGTGYLASKLAATARYVIGVDASKGMIDIAKREFGQIPHLEFVNQTIEEFSREKLVPKFEIAVANMSLNTMLDLDKSLEAISNLLVPKGIFVFNVTHPCFYNQYRKYESTETFQYENPHIQRGKLIISNEPQGLPMPTVHFHRPLQEYFKCLRTAAFAIDELLEPYPDLDTQKMYLTPWREPHFLSIRCIKKC